MKKKYSIFISITVIIVLAVLILGPGLCIRYFLINKKEVLSDYAIPYRIESSFGIRPPENAHHLYYARNRGLFVDRFVAFTLQNKDECEAFLAEINFTLDKFHKTDTLPQRFVDGDPESWGEKYADKNWQLTKEKEFMIAGPIGSMINTIVYVPDKCRIYLVHWAE